MNDLNPLPKNLKNLKVLVAALYLKGAPRIINSDPKNCYKLTQLANVNNWDLNSISNVLMDMGLFIESKIAKDPMIFDWAAQQIEAKKVLTLFCSHYPQRWINLLGAKTPPVLWKQGEIPKQKLISIVGSRELTSENKDLTQKIAEKVLDLGYAICSGGAIGVDSIVAAVARNKSNTTSIPLVEIFPYGLNRCNDSFAGCKLSVNEPTARFSTGNAMARNMLIYTASSLSIVIQPRYQQGGSWHGAVNAIRRNLSQIVVQSDLQNKANEELHQMGALLLDDVEDLEKIYHHIPLKTQLLYT